FTLYLPRTSRSVEEGRVFAAPAESRGDVSMFEPEPVSSQGPLLEGDTMPYDDRDRIQDGDLVLVIAEQERLTAERMLTLAHHHGFKGVIGTRSDHAIALAKEFSPAGIVLTSDNEGWMALDRLKRDLVVCHIPVAVIGNTQDRQRALSLGAFG